MKTAIISTKQLTYTAAKRQFTAEVSSLGDKFGCSGIPTEVIVQSHYTGRAVTFRYVKRVEVGPAHERETAGWLYRVDPEARPAKVSAPELAGMELMVFDN